MKTVLLLAAMSLALAGCGIKGDPQPPKSTETPTETQQAQ
ncbi:MAG: lipoprotein [Aestuariivirga sp.]|nr:lipoprotein [Aestuariivirga sp.]MCA3561727.1 lipoprotein [Aestuariivirga sp.]